MLSVDGVKMQSMLMQMKFNPQNFKPLKFMKMIVSQTLKTKIVYGTRYMVDSTKSY